MPYLETFNTTSTKSIYSKAHSQHKTRAQSQYDKAPLQSQKSNTFLGQTPSVRHNISKSSTFSKQSVGENREKTPNESTKQMQRLDDEFVKTLTDLENYYTHLTKHQQIRVERWIVKMIENDETIRWKQNRNNYLKLLHFAVKQYGTLTEPFDKMPDMNKDLPYLSDHNFNQKTKPRFDGKSPVFHIHKPEMIKIDEPTGDNCSVLMSIINTARTQISKQNNAELRNVEGVNVLSYEIKQSQLIEVIPHSFGANYTRRVNNNQCENEEQQQNDIPKPNTFENIRQMQISSVIPSNLPSQVKSFCSKFKPHQNNEPSSSLSKQKHPSKYKNHQKYSSQNSFTHSRNVIKQSLNSSYLQFGNRSSIATNEQLKVYKELVLAMGKLLLKHEFAIQKESEYWQLLRMIYSYQSSLRSSVMLTPKRTGKEKEQNEWSDRVVEEPQSFEVFLSRLRQEIEHNGNGESGNLSSSPHLRYTQDLSDPRQLSQSNRQSLVYQKHNFLDQNPHHTTPLYNQPQTINHITQQSLDFKVQQGAEPSHLLYYQLNHNKKHSIPNYSHSLAQTLREQKMLTSPQYNNNSLMQISDSYREVRRKNGNDDYHNIYNELEAVEDEEICFTKERVVEGETDRMYYKEQRPRGNVKEFGESPQFTDRKQEEVDQGMIFDQEEDQYNQNQDQQQQEEDENLMFSNSSNPNTN